MGLHHLSHQALLKWVNEWQADYYVIIAIKNNIIMIDECLTLTIISMLCLLCCILSWQVMNNTKFITQIIIKNLFVESVWYFKW